ncbi:hypothetical protein ACJIZ3_023817 [Penstemon smallii]|uniref:Uncharacterized protein n=1 Tax=Penstemon smallii TaxID=265156 RepID=A0ABD3TQ37_9LAMI
MLSYQEQNQLLRLKCSFILTARRMAMGRKFLRLYSILILTRSEICNMFDLYKTYTVSNAQVSKIDPNYDKLGYSYQWTINSKTACTIEAETSIPQMIPNMEFASLSNLQSIAGQNISVDVLVIVVQKRDQRSFTKEGKEHILREYAVINQEKKLVILTLWNAIAEAEGEVIDQAIHSLPIIRATKLSVSAYKDGSLGSTPSTTIELDPAIPQADNLKTWRSDNMRFIVEEILVQDHFRRTESSGQFSIDKISTLADLAADKAADKFIVRVCAKIKKFDQKFYYMACAKCFSAIGLIHLTIYDDSGYIDVTMFGYQAINIMQMDSEMCMQLHDAGKQMSGERINQLLEGKWFFMKIRKKTREIRGHLQTQYVVMDMRPIITEHQENVHEQFSLEKPGPSKTLTSSEQAFILHNQIPSLRSEYSFSII